MNYYIDFEASEHEQKIISIGCINQKGEEFYELVHTDDPITIRIEEITHINQKDIDNARSIDEVFSDFYNWCYKNDDLPKFICYGSSDIDFINNTFYDASKLKSASILGYMYLNLYDCSDEIKEHFYVNKTISLEKLANHYIGDDIKQNHNALDDAKLLKTVYESILNTNNETGLFTEYIDSYKVPTSINKILRLNGNTILQEFKSMDEAVKWLIDQPNDKGAQYLKDAAEKIKKAAKTNSKYFYSNWRIL